MDACRSEKKRRVKADNTAIPHQKTHLYTKHIDKHYYYHKILKVSFQKTALIQELIKINNLQKQKKIKINYILNLTHRIPFLHVMQRQFFLFHFFIYDLTIKEEDVKSSKRIRSTLLWVQFRSLLVILPQNIHTNEQQANRDNMKRVVNVSIVSDSREGTDLVVCLLTFVHMLVELRVCLIGANSENGRLRRLEFVFD